jgi:hypothetical protein
MSVAIRDLPHNERFKIIPILGNFFPKREYKNQSKICQNQQVVFSIKIETGEEGNHIARY